MLKRLFHALFANFRIKLLALVISLSTWFYANSRVTGEAYVQAEVLIVPPPHYVVVTQSTRTARVRISGPRMLISRLQSSALQNNLRLTHRLQETDLVNGWATVRMDGEWIRPSLSESDFVQLRFREFTPRTVRVLASPVMERSLPVRPRITGEPARGYRLLGAPEVVPSQVKVRGPAVVLDSIEALLTRDSMSIWDIRHERSKELAVDDHPQVRLADGTALRAALEVNPATVMVRVLVTAEQEQERTLADIPLRKLVPAQFPYEARLGEGVQKVSVVVRGSPQELQKLKPADVLAYIDLQTLSDQKIEPGATVPYQEQVRVRLPAGVRASVVRVVPERVNLLLKNPAGAVE